MNTGGKHTVWQRVFCFLSVNNIVRLLILELTEILREEKKGGKVGVFCVNFILLHEGKNIVLIPLSTNCCDCHLAFCSEKQNNRRRKDKGSGFQNSAGATDKQSRTLRSRVTGL